MRTLLNPSFASGSEVGFCRLVGDQHLIVECRADNGLWVGIKVLVVDCVVSKAILSINVPILLLLLCGLLASCQCVEQLLEGRAAGHNVWDPLQSLQ